MTRNLIIKALCFSVSISLLGFLNSCGGSAGSKFKDRRAYAKFRSKQESFTSKEGVMKYIDKGPRDGEVILLLHGVPTSGWLYRRVIDHLVTAGYRVVVPDMLGYGASDNPSEGILYDEKYHAARLLSLMDNLEVKQWHHVCHDAGGLWTQALTVNGADRLKSLTLLNTVLLKEGFHPPLRMKPGMAAKAAMASYRNKVTNGVMINALFNEGLVDCRELTDEGKYGYRRPLIEGKTNSLYYFFTQTCNELPDYRHGLRNLKQQACPVQVIWGVRDSILLWEPQSAEVTKLLGIKSSDIHLLEANHFLQEEKPEEVSNLIKSFISGKTSVK